MVRERRNSEARERSWKRKIMTAMPDHTFIWLMKRFSGMESWKNQLAIFGRKTDMA